MLLCASLFLSSPVWILPVILSVFSQEICYSRYSSGHNYSQTFPFHLWELVCFKSLNAFAFSWAMEASYGLWGFLCQHTPPSLGHTASPCTPSRLAMWNFIGTSKITGEQGNEHLALPSGTTEEPDWHCYCSCGPRETRQRASGTSRAVQSQAKSCSMMERGLISISLSWTGPSSSWKTKHSITDEFPFTLIRASNSWSWEVQLAALIVGCCLWCVFYSDLCTGWWYL